MKSIKLLSIVLLAILLTSFVSAEYCETSQILNALKKSLAIHYQNPKTSGFTAIELQSMLNFYLGLTSGTITVDCTAYKSTIDKAGNLPNVTRKCIDGTVYGACSATKPMYCYNGKLVSICKTCGCATGYICNLNQTTWGACIPAPAPIICTLDSDCGTSAFQGTSFCNGTTLYKNYKKYTCMNPGAQNALCRTETLSTIIDVCTASETCVAGLDACKQPVQNVTQNQTQQNTSVKCLDGTISGSCSIYKTRYCSNGVLIDSCSTCGCSANWICTSNQSCKYFPPGSCSGTSDWDYTPSGWCSSTKKYCQNGALIDKCSSCGCNAGYACQNDTCVASCSDGTPYNTCQLWGPYGEPKTLRTSYYCQNGKIIPGCEICGCDENNLLPTICMNGKCIPPGVVSAYGCQPGNGPRCDMCGCAPGYECDYYASPVVCKII